METFPDQRPSSASQTTGAEEAEPLIPDDSQGQGNFSASDDHHDDDAAGRVVASNPRFVRSFNRRIRTREPKGLRYKTFSGAIDFRQPEFREREEEDSNSQERRRSESQATVDNTENLTHGGRVRTVCVVDGNDNDCEVLCSPGSDEVFWDPDTSLDTRLLESTSIFYDTSSCVQKPTLSLVTEAEQHKDGEKDSTSMVPGDDCVDADYSKPKDHGGGLSFFSRLSKSVSLKRKYGKSYGKPYTVPISDEKHERDTPVAKENLESILENSQEKNKENSPKNQQSRFFFPASDWLTGDTVLQHMSLEPPGDSGSGEALSPGAQRDVDTSPTRTEETAEDVTKLEQFVSLSRNEKATSSLVCINSPPPPRTKKPTPVPLTIQNKLPEGDQELGSASDPPGVESSGERRESAGLSITHQIFSPVRSKGVSNTFYNLWPTVFPSPASDAKPLADQTVSRKSSSEINSQSDTSQQSSPRSVSSAKPQEDKFPGGVGKTCENVCLIQQSKVASHQRPQPLDHSTLSQQTVSSRTPSKVGQVEGNTPKKSKFRPSFVFNTENTSKKGEAERASMKEKTQKKEKITGERKATEAKACLVSNRLRRVGAIKMCEDFQHLLPDDSHVSLTSVFTITDHNMATPPDQQDKRPGLDPNSGIKKDSHNKRAGVDSTASIRNLSSTGAIPKTSNLNKTLQVTLKDVTKLKGSSEVKVSELENNNTEQERQEPPETKKGQGKHSRKRGKRSMERSISVPFWTKFCSQDSSGPGTDSVASSDKKLTNGEKVTTEDSKDEAGKIKSSPVRGDRQQTKSSHKRARSQDLTKTFKDELFSLAAPERSSSYGNISRLKQEVSSTLAPVHFLPLESPSVSNTEDSGVWQRHLSCSDIIEIGKEALESPRLTRAFRDSKMMSTSAFCLTSHAAKKSSSTKGSSPPALIGEDTSHSEGSLPPSPSGLSTRKLGSSQLQYTSPYDLVTQARDKPYYQRLINVFHIQATDSKMDSLVQQLDLYSKQGIPRQPHLLASQSPGNDDEVVVEDSWRTLVEGHEQLDERQEQQQSAIWELVETEATYIHMLKVITDLFLACLCNLQNESLLYEVDTDKLFSNIQEIYCANLTFWREHVVRMLEASRSSRQPLDPTLLTDAFYKFDELFHPYTRYCLEQSNCQLYCKEKDHDNEHFKMYLAWCETQKECNRLRLVDILVQPMQRLTKYSLLLKAILKKTNLEDHKLCLHNMITHVENFVSNVNSALRHKHEQERLRDIARRIEAYEAVETRDDELERIVRNYSDLNLTQPMPGCPEHMPRHLLHHGDLRFRDSHTSKMDVHVFLFTDLLLITKVTQRKAEKVKIVRPPYHVERLVLVDLKDSTSIGLVVINEWNVAVAAFTLQCPDSRTHRTWHDTLKRAKEQYKEAQQAQDVMVYDEMTCVGHLVPRSPRPGSSRASRVSSLVHSHSGSIDLNESSPATQHHPSIDMSDVRASSASSDDSVAQPAAEIQRSRSLEGGGCGAISPRPDRRPGYPKTPNTLSVIPPYSTGQSLPNLTVESANSLRVPGTNGSNPKALSPCTRGVSYPPPSPRTLRRSAPVPQSRNPPLTKARHVTSMIGSPQDVDQGEQDDATRGQRRTYRIDRMDNRRYHTAGAIDDIKPKITYPLHTPVEHLRNGVKLIAANHVRCFKPGVSTQPINNEM
ncbi:uncharacterized protein LOC121866850 isoform X2 [Homarus americanus]|nr:uncharacterized protein LOC121866850 isoform X2 [Homarus americanus]